MNTGPRKHSMVGLGWLFGRDLKAQLVPPLLWVGCPELRLPRAHQRPRAPPGMGHPSDAHTKHLLLHHLPRTAVTLQPFPRAEGLQLRGHRPCTAPALTQFFRAAAQECGPHPNFLSTAGAGDTQRCPWLLCSRLCAMPQCSGYRQRCRSQCVCGQGSIPSAPPSIGSWR